MSALPKCLISAGPTREWVDSVRFLSNPSSGKMGYALAQEANHMGFEVTLVSGPVALNPPEDVLFIAVESAQEMYEILLREFKHTELMIMSAAVSDHRAEFLGSEKIKKNKFPENLKLIPNPDILAELGKAKLPHQILVGFAAETSDHIENARIKLIEKNLDWVVVNDIASNVTGFATEMNEVTLLSRQEETFTLPFASKSKIATGILKQVWK